MAKKVRSPHDGFYKIGPGSKEVPRQTLFELREKTYASPVFVKNVQKAFENAKKYGLKVAKSKVLEKGKGIIHKGKQSIKRRELLAVYPGKLGVRDHFAAKDAFSDYVMTVGRDFCGRRKFDLLLVGKASKNAWDCNNVNHSCKPNCKFVRYPVKNGVMLEGLETTRSIKPGEELTVDYGLSYFKSLDELTPDPEFENLVCTCKNCPFPRAQQRPVRPL
jgi:hypothetical protein